MKFFAHLNTAVQILSQYQGQQPFGIFIKDFFRQDKKYGSRDRKGISHLCYCYFRLGKALPDMAVAERVVTGLFLCSAGPNDMLGQLKPEWNEQAGLSIEEKCSVLSGSSSEQYSMLSVFPWKDELSAGIDHAAFSNSFLVQPLLFLRVRPGKLSVVTRKLEGAGISFTVPVADSLALPNSSKVDEVIVLNKEAVIQDLSSQRVGELLRIVPAAGVGAGKQQPKLTVWDCCAASGGKSILAWDVLGGIDLTVSDIRESIIANLKKRFAEAGISPYQSFVADLSKPRATLPALSPDLIVADVPCSGSGTWSRTPEQLFYFDEAAILRYSELQKKIVGRVQEQLRAGGHLLYITCSVFREENEGVVAFLQQQYSLEVVKMELLKGYDQQADTMFAALLKKH
ncbi:MAG: Fmu (Sun) domain-containing protein [Niastella sp.]|nr:Fmu (Sun) domain-containing protein [Niastella sp.]